MNNRSLARVLGRVTPIFVALMLGVFSLFVSNELMAQGQAPALARPNEVVWDNTTSVGVSNAQEFLTAYRADTTARIVLLNNIDITSIQANIRDYRLKRSLQIDGNNFTLTSIEPRNLYDNQISLFYLDALPTGQTATVHLKNFKAYTRGTNYIDNGSWLNPRSEGWQLILDDVDFRQYSDGNEARRVARLGRGHIFIRNSAYMQTSGENFYAGQITVEPNAKIYGEINYEDYSTWWFSEENRGITSVDKTLNIGQNAHVELVGKPRAGNGGTTYPAIYEHWQEINVHRGATLKASKPGNAYAFHNTADVRVKRLNVYEGATLEGTSTGTGAQPIMEEKGGSIESHFYAAPGSTVKLIGQSNNANNALVHLRNRGSSFELDKPAVYDIRNNRAGAGSKAVTVGTGAFFKITNSDIEVWDGSRATQDFNGPPAAGWYRATVVANNSGAPVEGTYDPYNTSPGLMETWNTTRYSRITGVNANPALAFEDLTDADQSLYVNATVLGIPAWWSQQVTVNVTNNRDDDVFTGKNGVNGKFQYTLPDGAFFKAGTTYSATGYRGVPEWPTLETAYVTVRDVTPPTPVKVDGVLYHTGNRVTGTSDEPGASLSVTLNGRPINVSGTHVVRPNGTWEFEIPDSIILKPNDVLQVFLTDAAGNTNPVADTPFRDAIFGAATKIIVVADDVPPTLTLKSPVIYDKGQIVQENQFYRDAEVSADKVIARTESNFATSVNFNQVGAYVVNVTVHDRAGNSDTKSTVVLVKDENTVIDLNNDVMITAHDFGLNLSSVPMADFINLAEARAWLISSGDQIHVQLDSAKPITGGVHPVTFSAGSTKRSVNATISDDIDPILNADARVIYDKGSWKNGGAFLRDAHARLDKQGTITSDFETQVDLNKVGVYYVTIQGQDTAGNKSNVVRTTVLVKDENTIIDENNDTMITAHDFSTPLSTVPMADFVYLAEAQAWRISTGQNVPVQLVSPKPVTGGVHRVTLRAGVTTKNVNATIIDDVDPVLTADARIIYNKGTRKNGQAFLNDVHATLNEPGKITSTFDNVVDMNKVGVYIVILQGEDLAGNQSNNVQVSVIVKDEHTFVDERNDTMITAHDFGLELSAVPMADFVALADAQAWRISTGESVSVQLASGKPNVGGVHPVTFTAGLTSKQVNATINDNIAPILRADGRIIYDKGITRSEAAFLQDVHAGLDKAGTITTNFERVVDLNRVGVYIVTIQGEDTAGNKSNIVEISVLVRDENTIIDEKEDVIMITAHKFAVNLSDMPTADFVVLAEAQAWRISTGEQMIVTLETPKPTTGGVHEATFKAGNVTKTIPVNVIDDIDPILNADAQIIYNKGTSKNAAEFLNDVHAILNEEGTITSNFERVVDLNKVGIYTVTIQGEDLAGNKSNVVNTKVLVRDEHTVIDMNNDIMITAYDFALRLSEVPAADFVSLAQAQAWRISTGESVAVQHFNTKPPTGGLHPATFSAGRTMKTVTVSITDDIDPILTADKRIVYDQYTWKTGTAFLRDINAALDKDGTIATDFETTVDLNTVGVYVVTTQGEDNAGNKSNIVRTTVLVKDEHTIIDVNEDIMITAHDFDINLSEVPGADFVKLAEARAWRISTSGNVSVRLVGPKPTTGGVHDVRFRAGNVTKTVKVTVTDDVDPILTATSRIVYDKGTDKTKEAFLTDVRARLNEPGTITSDFDRVVDLNTVGVYIVSIQGEDEAGNKSNIVSTSVIVRDEHTIVDEKNDMIITAHDFTINLSDVPSADFVSLAEARAWRISSGASVAVQHYNVKPTTGGKHPATFSAGTTMKTVTVTVTDNIVPVLSADARITYQKGTRKSAADFLTDIAAQLDKPGTITSDFSAKVNLTQVGIYHVTVQGEDRAGNKSNIVNVTVLITDENTIIDEDNDIMITGHDFTLKLSEVPNADFIARADARAWRISTGDSVDVSLDTTKPTTGGKHRVTFSANGTRRSVDATIIDDIDPILDMEARIIYDKDSVKTNEEFLRDAHAKLNEAGTITTDFDKVVDLNKVGAYVVTTQGQDEAGNKSNIIKTIVLVKDEYTVIDEANDTMITAHDFEVNLSDVDKTDFIKAADAQAWTISTGARVNVSMETDKPNKGGVHDVIFRAGNVTKAVKVTVIDDIEVILNADTRIIYKKDTAKTGEDFLNDVHAVINKAGTITSDFQSKVDLNKVGVYIVTVEAEDEAGNKANTVQVTVFVTDDYTIIDEEKDVMITGHDFTLELRDVEDADFIKLAEAQAWRISTGESIPVELVTNKPTARGRHQVTFTANNARKSVRATITDNAMMIEADHVRFSVADFNKFQAAGTLEQEVLKRSRARAYMLETGEERGPLTADITEFINARVRGGEVYNSTIHYAGPSEFADVTGRADDPTGLGIKVSIDKPMIIPIPVPKLPITGEDATNLMLGLATVLGSLGLLFFIILFRRKKEDEEEDETDTLEATKR